MVKTFCDGCKSEITGIKYHINVTKANGYDFGADLCGPCRNKVAEVVRSR